jgi:two-component system nitrate/nitrite response regulator NarL
MRVMVVSAFPTVRAGLRAVVQAHEGWSVVAETSPDALRGRAVSRATVAAEPVPADIVLADIEGPLTTELMASLASDGQPRAGIVAVGASAADPAVRALLGAGGEEWLSGLGLGLLPRDASGEEIVAAVEAAASGLVALDRRLARALAVAAPTGAPERAPGQTQEAQQPGEPLTARELEVLQLLAEGLPNKLIAARLHVSEHTAKFHVASIMTKLGAASRTEAVTLAARRGLLIL